MSRTIEQLILENIPFVHGQTSKGWQIVYCAVCGDGSRTKGPRGGWIFQDEMAFYNCFNCGIDGSFDPNREHPFSKDMRKILDSFNINSKEYNAIAYKNTLSNSGKEKPKNTSINIPIIEIPDHFYELKSAASDNVIAVKAINYLKSRNIQHGNYPFYLSTGKSNKNPREEAIAKVLAGRLIIPFFKGKNMIYYQARRIDFSKTRYINADVSRDSVIYGYDKLYENINYPLFITEGFFDAYHLNGIAVLENKMSKNQIEIIKRSPRRKILIPDKKSDSNKLAEQAVENGWEISIPDIGNCKDIDEAIKKFGKLYVAKTVMDNIKSPDNALIFLKISNFL